MKVTVDEEKCCGAGQCALIAPEVFSQREDDRIVVLLQPAPPEPYHEAVREAAATCPRQVIELIE